MQDARPEQPQTFHRQASGDRLLVGAAEEDITPAESVYLGGFGMNRTSTGVHLPLKVRAITFAVGDMRIAIVGIDSLGLERDDVEWIKSGVYGYQNGCVFLCSSHTHAAPDLIGIWGPYFLASGRSREYLTQVRTAVARAVATATERARPAVLVRGDALTPPTGFIRNANRRGVFDRRLTVLHARDAETGAPLGTLLHVGCHPEVLRRDNTLISSDFVGELCDGWRDAGHGQAVFVNGALGAMISPQPANEEGIGPMADALLAAAERAVADAQPIESPDLEVRRRDLFMPLTSPGLALGRLTMVLPRRAYEGEVCSTVGWLRIGTFLAACVPGEMEPTLAHRIRAASGEPDLLIFGLTDDEIGYLMREVDARDPEYAYERSMSPVADTGEYVFDALFASPIRAIR